MSLSPTKPREIFRVQHNPTRTIIVRHFREGDRSGLDVIVADINPATINNVLRAYNPAEVSAWFNQNSVKNLLAWKLAYWKSGLGNKDFVRPAPKVVSDEPAALREVRQSNNAARLKKIYPTLRPKIAAVIADMEGQGWRPQIDVGVYRTPAEQAEKVRQGYSKVSYSYHTVTGSHGEPESLAADIVDTRYGWEAPSTYWLQLASAAEGQGMATGIRWGLSTPRRAAINLLIRLKNWSAKYAEGWDAAHVEVKGISLSQAKRGVRPK